MSIIAISTKAPAVSPFNEAANFVKENVIPHLNGGAAPGLSQPRDTLDRPLLNNSANEMQMRELTNGSENSSITDSPVVPPRKIKDNPTINQNETLTKSPGGVGGSLRQGAELVTQKLGNVFQTRESKRRPYQQHYDEIDDPTIADPSLFVTPNADLSNGNETSSLPYQERSQGGKQPRRPAAVPGSLNAYVNPQMEMESSSTLPGPPLPMVASPLSDVTEDGFVVRNSTWSRGDRRHQSYTSTASSTRSNLRGSTLSFHNVNYTVNSKRWPWSKMEKKNVLCNVSGIMKPGMNAIMGPTGSGKSSLLDVLAGRKDPRYLEGIVLVDGKPQPSNFKCISGYVVQDDIVMGTLTVKENLRFSAALRLPQNWTKEKRKAKVDEIMEELGLSHVADTKIGTELIRGVSGGEKKRTNIGIELITDPAVLFLDEPTTGLDAFTANSVIKTLRNLALRGRTIIFSIHQPKYSIYKLFDNLTLVCKGEIVYHGPSDNHPINYFKTLGYICEAFNNPPDFFLDILHGEVKAIRNKTIPEENEFDSVSLTTGVDDVILQIEESRNISESLIQSWRDSPKNRQVKMEVDEILQNSELNEISVAGNKHINHISYRTSFYVQMLWVSWRTGLNLIRNPQSSVIQLAVYLFFAMSIGVVYLKIDSSAETGIQNRTGLFFFITLQMVFVNLAAIEIFIKERQIFIHETSSGFYRTSAYFFAKIFCDMIPIKAMPVVIFMPITYWMVGLRADAGAFFIFEITLLLTTMAGCGVAFFVSASVEIFGVANILISITYVFMMVFGGYLINLKSMAKWLSWCRYLSIFRYSLSSLCINELTPLEFCSTKNTTVCIQGTTYLDDQDMPHWIGWDLWQNILGLIIITLVFCSACYVQLRRINRYK